MNNDDLDSLVYIACAINATLLSPTVAGVKVCRLVLFFREPKNGDFVDISAVVGAFDRTILSRGLYNYTITA